MQIYTSLAIVVLSFAVEVLEARSSQSLGVSANISGEASISSDDTIELVLSRRPEPREGRIAVFFNDTDVTSLFKTRGATLTYRYTLLPLPVGENVLIVYLLAPDHSWREIGRFPLRIEEKLPSKPLPAAQGGKPPADWSAQWQPSLTFNLTNQSTVSYLPESNRPQRYRFTDLSMQAGVRTDLARGSLGVQNRFDILGFSYRPQALRYGQLGEDAPLLDMPGYLVQFNLRGVNLRLGHSSFGTHRYLMNEFNSRGLGLAFSLGRRADFSFSAMNGTSIVGWDNFFGLDRRKHQVHGGIFGLEFLPGRPGSLRVELHGVSGSLLPLSNYTQANLNDAERSIGLGGRLLANGVSERLRLEAGLARSRFTNPADALLDQGLPIVEVRSHAANARYVDASYQFLRDRALAPGWSAGLLLLARYSRVDPLYRSVAVYAQADRQELQCELSGNIGEIALAAGMNRADDNLANIPSVLKTLSRRANGQITVPLSAVTRVPATWSKLLPRLLYAYDQTHQYGAFLPVNGGFDETAVPDQLSTNQVLSVEWQQTRWRAAYRFNESFQDNRHPGRERSDLMNQIHSFAGAFKPHARLDISFDLSSERSRNFETGARFQIWRSTTGFSLLAARESTLALSLGTTFQGDLPATNKSRNIDFDAQWSTRFYTEKDRYRKVDAQIFIRYARRYARSFDNLFLFDKLTELQTLNAGLRITFF